MKFDRLAAKTAARNSISTNQPSPLLVTLLYLLLNFVVSHVIALVTGSPLTEIVKYFFMGYGLDEAVYDVFGERLGGAAVLLAGKLLTALYQTLMSFGYTSYALRLARNEQPGYGRLFDGFVRPFRVLWASILLYLLAILFSLLVCLPLVPIFRFLILVTAMEVRMLTRAFLFYFLVLIADVAVMIIISLHYRLVFYILLDDPECTAREALKRSRTAMKGWKKELFVLDLSFLLWTLLEFVTLGVAGIWVEPYHLVTQANFYDTVIATRRTAGESNGYMGQIYQENSDLESKPF